MVQLLLSNTPIISDNAECRVFFVEKDGLNAPEITKAAQALFPALEQIAVQRSFTGSASSTLLLTCSTDNQASYVLLVGLGARKNGVIDIETYRRAVAKAIRVAEQYKIGNVHLSVPDAALFNCIEEYCAEQTTIAIHMAAYEFDMYITDADRKCGDITVVLHINDAHNVTFKAGVTSGELIANAVNRARQWINLPPSTVTPHFLMDQARTISRESNITFTSFNEEQAIEMGMGGLAAVGRGSEHDAHMIIMEYSCGDKNAPTVAFVGKGITFDSGGLSIKPADAMETMKDDMSAAAAVISSMQVIATIKPRINVIGLAPVAENMPGHNATRPGDIVRFYNGKTAEIRNTDAEGRLILADALSYAVKHYKPDAIIDLATLTGACSYALGPFFAGLMGKDEALLERIEKAGKITGDRVWRLPFVDDYKPAILADVADINNIGSRKYRAGAITAGFFLYNFVDNIPWAHIDIAGTAFDVPDIPYYRHHGATGYGVRLIVELTRTWNQK